MNAKRKKLQEVTPLSEINAHYDPDFRNKMARDSLSILTHNYFRAEIKGLENVPARADGQPPRIFYSNHSGMSFPWDAIVFGCLYLEEKNFDEAWAIRALVAPLLSATRIMNPFLLDNIWKKAGGVDATLPNFHGLMKHGNQDVLIFPEGVPGIGKGFDRKYEIQKFSTSFIRMAIQYKADIIPYYTINAEYVHPFAYKNDMLNSLVQRLGIPMLPLSPLTALVAIFPFLFYFGLPAKLTYVIDKPIQIYKEFEGRDIKDIKRSELVAVRDRLHRQYQAGIDKNVALYGQDPYQIESFVDSLIRNYDKLLYLLPSGWPLLFEEEFHAHYEGAYKSKEKSISEFFQSLPQHLDALSFMLPIIGWPILFLSRGLIESTMYELTHQNVDANRMASHQKAWFSGGRYIGPERRRVSIPVAVERRKGRKPTG